MKISGNGAVIDGAHITLEKGDKFYYMTLIRCVIDDVENGPFNDPIFENCNLIDCSYRSHHSRLND